MSAFKLLIDTNVFIGLEDPKRVDPALAELVRKCAEFTVGVFVHQAALADIGRDKDAARREISLSKVRKFQELKAPKLPEKAALEAKFGAIRKPNDEVDVALLHALDLKAVDLLITEDLGIHGRVKLSPLASQVLTVADALAWLRWTFDPTPVALPLIEERKAYEVDQSDEIFDSLREGYPDFNAWWAKCVQEHRPCWVVTVDGALAGIVVRKDERRTEAAVTLPGEKILKICTFKVRPEYRGEKLGELLLKQVLWYAQRNGYNLTYVTTYANQETLIRLLEYYGFLQTAAHDDGELIFEKPLSKERLEWSEAGPDLFTTVRTNYPRFVADNPARVFCVPIQGDYHQKLFPELAFAAPMPLFPDEPALITGGRDRTPGNTIRKVYLCRSKTKLDPGDVLLFYQSKTGGMLSSQAITSVGVVERVSQTDDVEELVRLTAKRSVFSETELRQMVAERAAPVRVIDFLLIGHLDPTVPLATLTGEGVFNGSPPQSICSLPTERFAPIRRRLELGFEV